VLNEEIQKRILQHYKVTKVGIHTNLNMNYPAAGVRYFIQSPGLWKDAICLLCFAIVLTFIILIMVFVSFLKPQAEFFNFSSGFLSYTLSVIACFIETTVIVSIILLQKIEHAKHSIWVKVMQENECWDAKWDAPTEKSGLGSCLSFGAILKFVALPVNLLPVVGTIVYAAINATLLSWDYNAYYYEVLQLNEDEQRLRVFKSTNVRGISLDPSNAHFQFGLIATLLEMVPILGSTVFTLGNVIGVALWNCDDYKKGLLTKI